MRVCVVCVCVCICVHVGNLCVVCVCVCMCVSLFVCVYISNLNISRDQAVVQEGIPHASA